MEHLGLLGGIAPLLAAAPLEAPLVTVLVQLAVILLAARVFAVLFRQLGQPAVVGEIAAGLLLGPSALGRWWPAASKQVFDPGVAPVFTVLSQLGLIFLLFLIGLEFDFSHLRRQGRAALGISLAGVVLPFALGWGLAQWMAPRLGGAVEARGFALFMGVAMAITAIPVLGRIMMELNLTRSRLGALTITAAAVDDALGWILLAAVSAVVSTQFHPLATLTMLGETVAFALLMIVVARPLLLRGVGLALRRDGDLGLSALALLLVVLFLCAIATAMIGIFAIFGAFLLGAVLSGHPQLRAAVTRRLGQFVTVFFLPIFFTYTGLRTDIGALESGALWLMAGAVCLAAVVGKFAGCAAAARLGGLGGREAACIGTLMNARGLMELVVINVGYELGVLPRSVFCMLVLMALVTTVMTTPVLLWFAKGTELAPLIAASGFRGPFWWRLGGGGRRARSEERGAKEKSVERGARSDLEPRP